ncbi:MAG: DNA mismatch repair protein MutS [Bacteroidetes bacterium]|nr:DNA mismatch repair protein MutS [Bacteroidota bacterium]MBU1720937.1 DNA mismatch repair protein MutS [Bacteroidota bacterium]
MKQYNAIKVKYPDALLLFRVGDFYETFGEDAIRAAAILGIVLTRRANGAAAYIELAGFPHHALDTYLPKLVKAGLRVAICDQLEDPKLTKTIVKRGVTELVTPGISFNDKILDHKSNNYLASIFFAKDLTGVAFLDISTAEFYVAEGTQEYVDKLLQGFRPSEVIYPKNRKKHFLELYADRFFTHSLDEWVYSPEFANEILLKQFQTTSLKGFGIEKQVAGIIAAGAALQYLADTQHDEIGHIRKISRIDEENHVWLDRFTIRNLELLYSPHEDARTLLDVVDHSLTPMGSRMMKRWITLPLKNIRQITERHEIVEFILNDAEFSSTLSSHLEPMGDIERLISKVAVMRINPREMVHIRKALLHIEVIKNLCAKSGNKVLSKIADQLNPCQLIREKMEATLTDEPPMLVNRGNVIRDGVNEDLDDLRTLLNTGKDYLAQLQQREIQNTGIPSLKISFNNVFGYYLEVRNTHKDKVPAEWIRKQTLVSSERYITPELKEYEEKILGAEEKILTLETGLFTALVEELREYVRHIQLNASLLAYCDCLLSFVAVAKRYNYTRPELNEGNVIDIRGGRHPVIELQLPDGEQYIANDVYLDDENQQIIIITGPNMAGKSALLRQTALIVLLAQVGCFVPADSAKIGVVDKIFTRVGASDNISSGESTFMVEMNETASILNNLSGRSLILLDEIGRGTSTYDGISIAWSIVEYLHQHPTMHAKVLFATHYHELNEMEAVFTRIKNFNVSVKEVGNKVIFLRKLVPGGSAHSFGIQVARMAGIPDSIVKRAGDLLKKLEKDHGSEVLAAGSKVQQKITSDYQLSLFTLDDPVLQQIKEDILNTDLNTLTPIEALMKLNEIKKIVGG